MKVNRCGVATALSADEFELLLESAPSPRYRALWAIQQWTGARIGDTLALRWGDLNAAVTFRIGTQAIRQSYMTRQLKNELDAYRTAWEIEHGHSPANSEALFPAADSTHAFQTRQAADKALRKTCKRIGLTGVSTDSLRLSAKNHAPEPTEFW